jgi:hypothetical protein
MQLDESGFEACLSSMPEGVDLIRNCDDRCSRVEALGYDHAFLNGVQ